MAATTEPGPRATDRGLALLRVVAENPGGLSLADAARAVALTPSTALRQLRSLEAVGFAIRDGDGSYTPGPELLRLARSLAASITLPRLAAPLLQQLTSATGETTYLAEPTDRSWAVYTAMEEGTHAVRHVSWLGCRVPRRGTAVGAALAGRVEADGTVLRSDSVEPGVTAISAPVRDMHGAVVAAISVVGPSYRLLPQAHAARLAVAAAAASLDAARRVG